MVPIEGAAAAILAGVRSGPVFSMRLASMFHSSQSPEATYAFIGRFVPPPSLNVIGPGSLEGGGRVAAEVMPKASSNSQPAWY